MANPNDKRTASQRIDDLERAVMSMYQTANNMARDLITLKEAIKLLGGKVDAICQANQQGEQFSNEVLSRIMMENHIEELKKKVQTLVDQGFFIATDTAGKGTFVVGSENEADGKVVNARLQFTLSSLGEELQKAFEGKKVGETITFKEDALRFQIQEVYRIVDPTQQKAEEKPAEAAAAPEQPKTEEQSSNNAEQQQAAPVAEQSSQSAGN